MTLNEMAKTIELMKGQLGDRVGDLPVLVMAEPGNFFGVKDLAIEFEPDDPGRHMVAVIRTE